MKRKSKKSYSYTKRRTVRNLFLGLLVVVILGMLVITCPDRETHKHIITTTVNDAINDHLASKNDGSVKKTVLAVVGGFLANTVTEAVVDKVLEYDNYFVFSTTHVTFQGDSQILSYGVLGHVFTVDKETLKKKLQELK